MSGSPVDVKADAPTRSNSHEDKIWNRLTLREIEIGGIGPFTEGVLIVEHIALALRAGAPIYVAEEVITNAKSVEMTKEANDSDRLRQWLEKLDPDEPDVVVMCPTPIRTLLCTGQRSR